ncbi:hypothetical protein BDW42DRAFT_47762 [Aspergillus taichungensis]|uniref:Uncharacterized protein n=1 Tax=Aspergillus taichungensis TaxID=482145 RepID=A0A2J5HDP3_9EURO|nr:hypothetical protein BDW42DRAFT_47762 [Aspergillus taichungensis]
MDYRSSAVLIRSGRLVVLSLSGIDSPSLINWRWKPCPVGFINGPRPSPMEPTPSLTLHRQENGDSNLCRHGTFFFFLSFLFLPSPLLRERYGRLDVALFGKLQMQKGNHGVKREKGKRRGKTVFSLRVEQARRLPEYLESSGYPDLPTMNHHGLMTRPDYTTSWCDSSNQREKKEK